MSHDHDLAFPRLVYRGAPDTLGTGLVGETLRVEDREAYDAAVKSGWRLERHDAKHAEQAPAASRGSVKIPAQTIEASTEVTPATTATVDPTDAVAGEKARKAEAQGGATKADKNAGALKAPARNSLKK